MFFKRFLLVFLVWASVLAPAAGQEAGGLRDPDGPDTPANTGAGPPPSLRVSGVLISPSKRVAIINGRLSREGDRVDGAEILSIDTGVVRVRTGSGEFTVHLGPRSRERPASVRPVPRDPPPHAPTTGERAAGSVPTPVLTLDGAGAQRTYGPVESGETLSAIAHGYLRDGITLNQMMIALFEANAEAFGGNINVLYEGAVLRVPNAQTLANQLAETATAQVLRQTEEWHSARPGSAGPAPDPGRSVASRANYGPVERGETLSEIAAGLLDGAVTLDQVMIALFETNRPAFSGNINVLYEGAMLRIPKADDLHQWAPDTASAEVVRHTDAWRAGRWRSRPSPVVVEARDPGGGLEPRVAGVVFGHEAHGRSIRTD